MAGSYDSYSAWLTTGQQDAVTGYPAGERYPGPADADHSSDGPVPPGGRGGPPSGTAGPGYPGEVVTIGQPGGVITDHVADLGSSGPVAPFDAQTVPFAPSGPVAGTHGLDTGGTYRREHVTMPKSPGWYRRTGVGQTNNRQSFVTDNAGWRQLAPNDRTNLDQYQGQDAEGYDPFWQSYSERPVLANFAAEAHPLNTQPVGGYVPDGSLPDMTAMGGQGDFGYTAPPDPTVTYQAPAASGFIGMEYVNG